jgi:multidrug resistance efflux pump
MSADSVRRGQLLARGDDAQLLAQLAQQDATIKQARAERVQADANLERAERVEDSGLYSVEALQTRRTAALQAAAKVELAEAQRRELEVRSRTRASSRRPPESSPGAAPRSAR